METLYDRISKRIRETNDYRDLDDIESFVNRARGFTAREKQNLLELIAKERSYIIGTTGRYYIRPPSDK